MCIYLCLGCSQGCKSRDCNQSSGYCTGCKHGFWGDDCTQSKLLSLSTLLVHLYCFAQVYYTFTLLIIVYCFKSPSGLYHIIDKLSVPRLINHYRTSAIQKHNLFFLKYNTFFQHVT